MVIFYVVCVGAMYVSLQLMCWRSGDPDVTEDVINSGLSLLWPITILLMVYVTVAREGAIENGG